MAGVSAGPIPTAEATGRIMNYPNPVVHGSTTFTFFIDGSEHARLEIYDLLGRRVATVFDRDLQAGMHSVEWNDIQLDPGTYQCMLRGGRQVLAGRLIVR